MGYHRMNLRQKNNQEQLILNHFEFNGCICTKSGLVRTLKKYYDDLKEAKASGYTIFDSTPTTFLISMIGGDSEYLGNFINRYREIEKGMARKERTPLKHCTENIWLVKPENMN